MVIDVDSYSLLANLREFVAIVGEEVGHIEAVQSAEAIVSSSNVIASCKLLSTVANDEDSGKRCHHHCVVARLGVVVHADANPVESDEWHRKEATEGVGRGHIYLFLFIINY